MIYGDIGTSPLYVYSSTFTEEPRYDDLLGALSLIIWTLTLMVSIKYVLIVLRADDEGEGGTFAIYSLLSRYVWPSHSTQPRGMLNSTPPQANIVRRDPREERTIKMERSLSTDLNRTTRSTRSFLERSGFMKAILKIVGVLGVSLVMSGMACLEIQKHRSHACYRWCSYTCAVCARCYPRVFRNLFPAAPSI